MAENYNFKEYRDISDANQIDDEDGAGVEDCIASGFGGGVTHEDARHHMTGGQVVVARSNASGEVTGFSSTSVVSPFALFSDERFSDDPAGYFAGAAVSSSSQGRGLYAQPFSRRFGYVMADETIETIYTRTQNPLVYKGISHGLELLVSQRRIREARLAQAVIMPSVYPGKLMQAMPEFFDDIDTEAGDAKVFVWQIKR